MSVTEVVSLGYHHDGFFDTPLGEMDPDLDAAVRGNGAAMDGWRSAFWR